MVKLSPFPRSRCLESCQKTRSPGCERLSPELLHLQTETQTQKHYRSTATLSQYPEISIWHLHSESSGWELLKTRYGRGSSLHEDAAGRGKKRGSLLVCYSSLNYGSLLQPIPALPQTPKLRDCSKQSGKKSSLSSETLQRCFVVGLEPFQQINTCLLKARFSTKRQRWRGFCSSWIKGCFTSF